MSFTKIALILEILFLVIVKVEFKRIKTDFWGPFLGRALGFSVCFGFLSETVIDYV